MWGIDAMICGLAGVVTSTMTIALRMPMSAYSRPEGEVYPQQSLPALAVPSAARSTCACSWTLLEVNWAAAGPASSSGAVHAAATVLTIAEGMV